MLRSGMLRMLVLSLLTGGGCRVEMRRVAVLRKGVVQLQTDRIVSVLHGKTRGRIHPAIPTESGIKISGLVSYWLREMAT
jgi:hypothetical protein